MKCGTDAFQAALDENRIVRIPAREMPYLIDRPIIVPSHRRIIADGAAIRLADGVDTLMLRNEHTHDGYRTALSHTWRPRT